MKRINDFRLYLITDRLKTSGRPIIDVVHEALKGGVKAVQLREKGLSTLDLYRLALDMRRLTSQYNAAFIINDRIDIAKAVDADGVHIGVNGMPLKVVRQIIGKNKIIGYSAHSIEEAERVQGDGADFVTFSPVYYTPSKADLGSPCGLNILQEAVSALKIPVIALGGISLDKITETFDIKVAGIAVISAIIAATDPQSATADILKKIEEHV